MSGLGGTGLADGAAPAERRRRLRDRVVAAVAGPAAGALPVEAEGLVRRFGSTTAVAGVDLSIAPGEVFGFLGPNGAGKTTCVRMLVTLLRPTSGWARVCGRDVVRETYAVRRAIGVALQEASIDPFMTGCELLDLQGALHGLNRARTARRGGELLERVGLAAVAGDAVSTYSGGMRRRLDLAMALLHEPAVLFLDEPTAGLDPLSRTTVWEEVAALNAEHGTTVFLTTHYLEEADRLAGRIAILDHGRIVKEGSPEALKAEIGAPALTVTVPGGRDGEARSVLAAFGSAIPAAPGKAAVRLRGGAPELAAVVRAMDAAGLEVRGIEVTAPSMDDVFAAATGRPISRAGDPEPA
ncbi:MAG TPA: ATP-binding cassette domain-containing protein [Acidimicrobiales bacterium]|nr:ATP-binding cassette domain-containing protein [Acidimicrobiales bacterium]